ncbi:hypothetical protein KM043_009123 [Ampulex compressa]|nr:hypothetical protein KM043_009123 [Ampulex compressa]
MEILGPLAIPKRGPGPFDLASSTDTWIFHRASISIRTKKRDLDDKLWIVKGNRFGPHDQDVSNAAQLQFVIHKSRYVSERVASVLDIEYDKAAIDKSYPSTTDTGINNLNIPCQKLNMHFPLLAIDSKEQRVALTGWFLRKDNARLMAA